MEPEYKGETYRQCIRKVRAANGIEPLDSGDEGEGGSEAKKRKLDGAGVGSSQAFTPSQSQDQSSSQGFSSSQGRSMAAPMTVEDLEFACTLPPMDPDEAAELEEEMRTLSQAY